MGVDAWMRGVDFNPEKISLDVGASADRAMAFPARIKPIIIFSIVTIYDPLGYFLIALM